MNQSVLRHQKFSNEALRIDESPIISERQAGYLLGPISFGFRASTDGID
jgi:hypothetical protein